MPYRRRAFSGRRRGSSLGRIVNSMKNVVDVTASTGTTLAAHVIANAVASPSATTANEVERGCIIKAIYCNFDFCGLAASGILQRTFAYLIKNPGTNLTLPGASVVGTSNEKKFVIRQWQFMTMRNQDGNNPNHWEGWIPIPKRYQRMGTDDLWQLAFEVDATAGHSSAQFIYKWYT